MDQQVETRLSQIEASIDSRIGAALQGTASQVQKALDAMGDKWQKDVEAAVSSVATHVRQETKAGLFTGLFEKNAAEFLRAVDDANSTAPQLQRSLYAASDAAVAGLNHGPAVRFRHFTDIELGATVAASALVGIGLRAAFQRGAQYLKQRRERKAAEASTPQF